MNTLAPQPIGYSVADACRVSSLGKTFLYAKIKAGSLRAHKVGKRTIINADSLRQLLEAA